jgi:SAM-dependent methyltransferase
MRLNCPVCKEARSSLIVERMAAPILMHNVFETALEAHACRTGHLAIRRCDACGFAWNAAFDPDKIVYGPGYDNAQGFSPQFQSHLDARIDAILALFPKGRAINIIEVGAGQGDFLLRLKARGGERIGHALGFDPAWKGSDGTRIGEDIRMYRRVFDAEAASIAAEIDVDLVLSRHVIEHVSEPMAFLAAIRSGIIGRPATRLVLETPDIDWILKNSAFEDLFYEHCSIFSPGSMAIALEAAGFSGADVETVFAGQYLWATARFAGAPGGAVDTREQPPAALFSTDALAHEWRARIDGWRANGGRVAIWGAGAKGMTFAQIVDPGTDRIAAIIDMNPNKQGKFIGVTGHPIASPDAIPALAPSHIVVMNPNYAPEIRAMLAAKAINASLLTLHEDFL